MNTTVGNASVAADTGRIYTDGSYLERHRTWHVEDSPWKAEQIRAILSRNNVHPSRVCEVGCGAGEILRQLSSTMRTARFDGYELSPQAFALCAGRESDRLQYHLQDVLEEDVHFDCLLCIDVLEHIEDYIGFAKALRPKAEYAVFHIPLDVTMLSVWRGGMMQSRRADGHLHYFTRETALATLRDCGYHIVDHCYTQSFRRYRGRIGHLTRALLFAVSPDAMVTVMGGCSLLVLARPQTTQP